MTGEHTVLFGHPALALPWFGRTAKWTRKPEGTDEGMIRFGQFLETHEQLSEVIDISSYQAFAASGGYLDSNIPFGYGLGSSGSFCAAVLDRFSNPDREDRVIVLARLRQLESFFHGQSSGLDPMISFYQKPIYLHSGEMEFPEVRHDGLFTEYPVCLIDSKIERNTQQLIQRFKQHMEQKSFRDQLVGPLVDANERLIQAFIEGHEAELRESWIAISRYSQQVFSEMIPTAINVFWKEGLMQGSHFCKLCGAGGGGLFLCYIADRPAFEDSLKRHGLELFS